MNHACAGSSMDHESDLRPRGMDCPEDKNRHNRQNMMDQPDKWDKDLCNPIDKCISSISANSYPKREIVIDG